MSIKTTQLITHFLCFALLSFGTWNIATARGPSTWTDKSGKYRTEAEFVKLDGNTLVLKRTDGKLIELKLSDLDSGSQAKAREEARAALLEKPASSTPANSSFPITKFPSNASAQQFADIVVGELKKKNSLVMWDMLPATYQKDAQDVAKLAVAKVDPAIFRQVEQIGTRAVKMLRNKKELILNNPTISQLIKSPDATKAYGPTVDLLEAYLLSDILKPERIKEGNLRDLLGTYLNNIATKAEKLAEVLPVDNPIRQQIAAGIPENFQYSIQETGGAAQLTMTAPPNPTQTIKLVPVEGRWLPEPMVQQWTSGVQKANDQLNTITPQQMNEMKTQFSLILATTVNPLLGQLENASDQQQFDEAIQNIAGLAGSLGGMLPGAGPGPGSAPPR